MRSEDCERTMMLMVATSPSTTVEVAATMVHRRVEWDPRGMNGDDTMRQGGI